MELGWMELLLIFVLAVLIFGPDKLPEFARTIGRWWREFNKLREMVNRELAKELEPLTSTVSEFQRAVSDVGRGVSELSRFEPSPAPSPRREAIDDDLRRLAEDLGVSVEGKSRSEVVREIREKVRELRGGDGPRS